MKLGEMLCKQQIFVVRILIELAGTGFIINPPEKRL
jgi:hypothetical protein